MNEAPGPLRRPILSNFTLVVIILLAAILRFYHLGTKSIWLDEGMSVGIAKLPWSQFFRLVWAREANMSAYYVLLHFWVKFGSSEFFVRSLSVLFGIATVAAVDVLGAELFGRRVGWIAAALLAVNAWHIAASKEARGYSLAILAVTLSVYFFARILRNHIDLDSSLRRNTISYTLWSALAVYSHFYCALVVFAQWLVAPFAHSESQRRRELFRASRFLLYLTAPLIVFVAVRGSDQLNWISALSGGQLSQFARELTGNGWALELLFAVALAVSAVSAIRHSITKRPDSRVWPLLLTWSWLLVPIVVILFASAVWKPIFFPRYLIIVLPALVLAAACGLAVLKPRWLLATTLLAILALSVNAVRINQNAYFEFGREDWRSATQYVIAGTREGDAAIFFSAPARLPFEFYRRRISSPARPLVIAPAHSDRPNQLDYRDFEPEPLAVTFQYLPENFTRVWLILSPYDPNASRPRGMIFLMHWCETRYHMVDERRFEGIDVQLYSKP